MPAPTSTRVVSVFGATGVQGGAVIEGLLKDGIFAPRALVRDPKSAGAQKLAARGVQVVQGDSLDKASLVRALAGSEAVFAMTVPNLTKVAGQDEVTQGRNIIDAAKEVGVKFLIWATCPDMKTISNGKYPNCDFYNEKVEVGTYLATSGLPHASIFLPIFLENAWNHHMLKKNDTGSGYTFSAPFATNTVAQFAWIARDLPAAVLALLGAYTDPTKDVNGKEYPLVSVKTTFAELGEKMRAVLDGELTITQGPPSGIVSLDEMWEWIAEYEGYYTTPIPNPALVALGARFSTVEEWLEEVKVRYAV
ncbi:hypothetical protein C8R46DRAFT_656314 [Mycena filopes]|nr:hypothetical protein C8R46DRAFT_656314 [Mycena filopes]